MYPMVAFGASFLGFFFQSGIFDFADLLTALSAFVTGALALVTPTTLIGGLIAVALGGTVAVGLIRQMIGLVRGRRAR
jgi:hypothetical protein